MAVRNWIECHPQTSAADGSPIEFETSGSGEDYIDFGDSMLYVQAKIVSQMEPIWGCCQYCSSETVSAQTVFSSGHTVKQNSDYVVDEY